MAFTSAREVDTVGEADSVTNEAKRNERYHTAGGGVVLAVAFGRSLSPSALRVIQRAFKAPGEVCS
jgi:hypothetical protein